MTDLTVVRQPGVSLDFTKDQLGLIKRQICKPKDREATNDELALFVAQAKRTGLDPMAKQIYAIFRKSKGVEQMTIQTAIDGFRLIAERTGCYLGQVGTWWCGPDEVWHEVWNEATPPIAAKVIVRKAVGAHVAENPAVAHWREYAATDYNGNLTPMWKNMPANQLAKCAEALALRKAFPNDLSGLYTSDEMAQAANTRPAPQPVQQAPAEMDPVTGEVLEPLPMMPRLGKDDIRRLQAAIDEAGVDKAWLQKQLVKVGVQDINHPHVLGHLTEQQAKGLLQALSDVIDERNAEEGLVVDERDRRD